MLQSGPKSARVHRWGSCLSEGKIKARRQSHQQTTWLTANPVRSSCSRNVHGACSSSELTEAAYRMWPQRSWTPWWMASSPQSDHTEAMRTCRVLTRNRSAAPSCLTAGRHSSTWWPPCSKKTSCCTPNLQPFRPRRRTRASSPSATGGTSALGSRRRSACRLASTRTSSWQPWPPSTATWRRANPSRPSGARLTSHSPRGTTP